MPLQPGTTLGSYSVTAKIGEGGMGEVYRARDTKLDRDVALKVLPQAFTDDPDRLARFEREAKVLASLNHSNIGGIHGLEESDGVRALVLEYIDGPTLADRIAQGPIPIDEALPIAKQIAEALEAAHEAGVIHRDLKPANIKVKDDGTVKVLDFGLAKAFQPDASDPNMSMSPTISLTAAATQMGMVMGTAAYMAPEQASGKAVDKRADVWAFGVVLYEMLTGARPFAGDDVSKTLARVIAIDPDWTALPNETPAALATFVRRCLEKEPKQRVHDVADVRLAIEGAFETTDSRPPERDGVASRGFWQRPAAVVLLILFTAILAGLAGRSLMPSETASSDLMRFTIVPTDTAPLDTAGPGPDLTISPDGTRIIYASGGPAGQQLTLRSIDELGHAPLRGAENAVGPFFSPGGQWVGFLSSPQVLQKVSIFGGPPVTLAESPRQIIGAHWGSNDQIIFGTNGAGLFRVSGGGGGVLETLSVPDPEQGATAHTSPFIIPNRQAVLFVTSAGAPLLTGQLAVLDLGTGEVTQLGLAGTSPRYVSTGHLVYAAQDGSVRAAPFDATSLEVTGNPVPVIDSVVVKASGAADFAISDNGRLVYLDAAGFGALQRRTLVRVARDGQEELLGDEWQPDEYWHPRFSPDGSKVAIAIDGDAAGAPDLWVLDLERPGARSRITFDGSSRYFPTWSPDGSALAVADGPTPPNRLLLAQADGSGKIETLLDRGEHQFPTSWHPDGRALAIYIIVADTSRDLAMLPMEGDDRAPVPFVATPFEERAGAFSPNGRWLAYVSNESDRDEVYVRPYPGPGQEYPISTGGGKEPVWSRDSSELFFRNEDEVLAVSVDAGESFSATAPRVLFAGAYVLDDSGAGGGVPNYDVAPDGSWFLMLKPEGEAEGSSRRLTAVLNWFEELTRLVPTN